MSKTKTLVIGGRVRDAYKKPRPGEDDSVCTGRLLAIDEDDMALVDWDVPRPFCRTIPVDLLRMEKGK